MSIIQGAVLVRDDSDYHPIPNNPSWDCLSYDFKGVHYDICFENDYYGDHARQFLVNGVFESPVKSKYLGVGFETYCESNSLCGEREFEHGSINQEFLYKPLGIIAPNHRDGWRSEFCFLKQFLEKNNIEFKKWRF